MNSRDPRKKEPPKWWERFWIQFPAALVTAPIWLPVGAIILGVFAFQLWRDDQRVKAKSDI